MAVIDNFTIEIDTILSGTQTINANDVTFESAMNSLYFWRDTFASVDTVPESRIYVTP